MDSDGGQNDFAAKGGQALDMQAFPDSEDVDEEEDDAPQRKDGSPGKGKSGSGNKEIKGEKLENQPYDLAVDVNDSEEIESDEEDDVVNAMNTGTN